MIMYFIQLTLCTAVSVAPGLLKGPLSPSCTKDCVLGVSCAELSRHVKPSGDVLPPESDEQLPKVKRAKSGAAAKKVAAGDQSKPKKSSGFSKPLKLSPELSAVVGTKQASRGECQKLLWAYIKEHGLQCPQNKSTILVHKDELLHKVLQVKECSGFGMSKYLKDHFLGPSD